MKVSGVSACLSDALQADWCVYPPLIFDFITLVTVKYVGFTLKHHFNENRTVDSLKGTIKANVLPCFILSC